MSHKDYSEPYAIFYEAYIDVMLLNITSYEYSDIISMWGYDFERIIRRIPLNDEGMYVGLAYYYHVDCLWEEYSPKPWEVDNIELSLSQLTYVKKTLLEENKNLVSDDNNHTLYQICEDICCLFQKANENGQKVHIKYYY